MLLQAATRIQILHISVYIFLWFSTSTSISHETDIDCLKSLKHSFHDPLNSLSQWDFNFTSSSPINGFICKFTGIECWNDNENRVLNINLSHMGLKGHFPQGIANCSSLTGLNLSHNNITGTIPSDISNILPFVTYLDLSFNHLSGTIPVKLANCSYLYVVRLDNNRLTGRIPLEIGGLSRIKEFSVVNNRLFGPVPDFQNVNISAASYSNNPGLCGKPLPPC